MKKYSALIAASLILMASTVSSFAQDGKKTAPTPAPKEVFSKKEKDPAPTPTRAGKANSEAAAAPMPKPLLAPKSDSSESFKTQLDQLQERFDEQKAQLAHQQEELNKLKSSLGIPPESSTASPTDSGYSWLASPLVIWTAGILFILSIALHAVHLRREARTSRLIGQLWSFQRRSATANRAAAVGANGGGENLSAQARQQSLCSACGTLLSDSSKFCNHCGASVGLSEPLANSNL